MLRNAEFGRGVQWAIMTCRAYQLLGSEISPTHVRVLDVHFLDTLGLLGAPENPSTMFTSRGVTTEYCTTLDPQYVRLLLSFDHRQFRTGFPGFPSLPNSWYK